MASFKIFFSDSNIRRITTQRIPTFEQFTALLLDTYPEYHLEQQIKYVDQDNDKIVVSSQLEWEEMFNEIIRSDNLIKLYIEEPLDKKFFKDGPNPLPQFFYQDVIEKIPVELNQKLEELQQKLPLCLEGLFRDGKIIPSAIPSFLQDAIKTKFLKDDIVDLDIDIPKFFDSLHKKAMECLESVDKNVIMKGKEYLISMLQIVPDHVVTLYNLACAEALLFNVDEAIKALENAVEKGYRNLSHMLQDHDLDNIRNTEAFKLIVKKLETLNQTIENINIVNEPEVIKEEEIKVEEKVIYEQDKEKLDERNDSLSFSYLDLRCKFGTQIQELKSMGFLVDDEVLALILEQNNGNIQDVVAILLQKST